MCENTNPIEEPAAGQDILVLGIGRAGGEILMQVDRARCSSQIDFLALDVHPQDLDRVAQKGIPVRLLGEEATGGRGVASDVELAQRIFQDMADEFDSMLGNRRLLVIAAGLGGCTGGAIEPLLSVADERNLPVVLLGVLPFDFESMERKERAKAVLGDVEMFCQVMLLAPGEMLLKEYSALPVEDAFAAADHYLADALLGVTTPFASVQLLNDDPGILSTLCQDGTSRCFFLQASTNDQADPAGALKHSLELQLQQHQAELMQRTDRAVALLRLEKNTPASVLESALENIASLLPPEVNLETAACVAPEGAEVLSATLLLHLPTMDAEMRVKNQSVFLDHGRERSSLCSEEDLGIFAGDSQNSWNGVNLDLPTYLRAQVKIHRGV